MVSAIWSPRLEREIEKDIFSFDLGREIWRANRRRFYYDLKSKQMLPIRPIAGGSFLTGTGTELIYSNATVGTAKTTFTTEFQINDTAGMGPVAMLPAYFFLPSRSRSQSIKVIARGVISTTLTPTWLWTFRLNPTLTPAVPPTGAIVAGNPSALTPGNSGVSATLWEAEFDAQLTVEGAAGTNSTLRGLGLVSWPGGGIAVASQAGLALFGGAASPGTVATVDTSVINTLTVGATCGTSNSSNSIQLLQLLVFGLN